MDYTINISTAWIIIYAFIHRYYLTKKKSETLYYEEGTRDYHFEVDKVDLRMSLISLIVLFVCFFLDDYFLDTINLSLEIYVFTAVLVGVVYFWRIKYYYYQVDISLNRFSVRNNEKIVFDHEISDILYISEDKKLNMVLGFKVYSKGYDSVYISRDFHNFELMKMKINEYKDISRNKD